MLSAIIVAAGQGKRLKAAVPKPLIKIGGLPAIIYSLTLLDKHPDVDEIILVINTDNQKAITGAINNYSFRKIKALVLGGSRRQDSVYNGLRVVSADANWVLIHDAARPLIDYKSVTEVIQAAKKNKAAILGVPVKATIKSIKSNGMVAETLDRTNLWEIQTPQVFKKELILKAYKKYSHKRVTDDASLVERLGNKIKIVRGSYTNIKITTPEDILFAQGILGGKR